MVALPEVIATASEQLAPHQLSGYATELAAQFHVFYRDCRVGLQRSIRPRAEQGPAARVQAARIVLARALGLMGVTAPEKM